MSRNSKTEKITTIFFSPTGGTKKIAEIFTEEISALLGAPAEYIDITSPKSRERTYEFGQSSERELVIVAMPTYAGRLPNKIRPDLEHIIKGGAEEDHSDDAANSDSKKPLAIALSVFGNRSPGDAPRELALLLDENGFDVTGMGAFVSRHAFSDKVGEGRPDAEDEQEIKDFAGKLAAKLRGDSGSPWEEALSIDLDRSDLAPYYTPLKEDLTPASFLKAKPVVDASRCVACGLCEKSCPVGSIEKADLILSASAGGEAKMIYETTGICIKCQACIRLCPEEARAFEDEEFLSHVRMLEQNYSGGRSPEQFYSL